MQRQKGGRYTTWSEKTGANCGAAVNGGKREGSGRKGKVLSSQSRATRERQGNALRSCHYATLCHFDKFTAAGVYHRRSLYLYSSRTRCTYRPRHFILDDIFSLEHYHLGGSCAEQSRVSRSTPRLNFTRVIEARRYAQLMPD